MNKRKLFLFLTISLLGVMTCVCCGLFLFLPSLPVIVADFKASRVLDVYPDSEKIFQAVGDEYYPRSDVAKRYYWTEDPVPVVRAYYEEELGYEFVLAQDDYGKWLITGFDRDHKPIHAGSSSGAIAHGSFCLNAEEPIHTKVILNCYTLALIDASQLKIHKLGVVSPSMFRYLTPPPELAAMSRSGTLIIFTYYRENFW